MDSVAGTIERTYDLLDRLTEEVTPEGTITYTHDDASRRATMTVAGQTAVSYTFDDANRLTGVTRGTAAVSLAYDTADRRTSLTLPNGIVVEYGYDDDSRLTGLTYKQGMSTLGTLTYAYDANGQRTSVGGTYARTGLPAALMSAILPDGKRIHYVCSNPEASLPDLRFEHTDTPTAFYKSTFKWTGTGWALTLLDGTVYEYGFHQQ